MTDETLTISELERFQQLDGRAAIRVIEVLNKNRKIKAAFETDVGKEILTEVANLMGSRLEQIVHGVLSEYKDDTHTLTCRNCGSTVKAGLLKIEAEYALLQKLMSIWSQKIVAYNKTISKIKQKVRSSHGG